MTRILMCGNHPSNKGGMTSVINQIKEHDWGKDGIELTFIPTYMPGSKIKTISYFAMAFFRIFLSFIFHKPDLFYTHMSVRGSFTRTQKLHNLCKLFRIKDIIHLHGSEFEQWYQSETAKKQQEIRNLITESSAFVVLGKKWSGFIHTLTPNANIVQIHNAVIIPEERVEWSEKIRFLFLGVLIKRKGVIDLLEAIKELSNQDMIDNCEFIIAGTGEEEGNLKQFVQDNELDHYVEFVGWISGSKKEDELKKSNVFILPSYNEGLPIAILEAMSYGMPIISSNVGDIPEAVKDGENGFLFSPGDTVSLANGIKQLTNEETWRRMSSNSRKTAEEQFNIDLFYENLLSLWITINRENNS